MITRELLELGVVRDHLLCLADDLEDCGRKECEHFRSMARYCEQPINAIKDEVELLSFTEIAPTGSRVICPGACEAGTDYDFICWSAGLGHTQRLRRLGYDNNSGSGEGIFEAWRKSVGMTSVNLIVTHEESFYQRFVTATNICRHMCIADKKMRIAMFQLILYWNVDPLAELAEPSLATISQMESESLATVNHPGIVFAVPETDASCETR